MKWYKKPLERQISEEVRIFSSEADILMNGKSEWMQPAVQRIQMTREVGSWRNAFGQENLFCFILFRTEFNLFLSWIVSIWHRRHIIKHEIQLTKPSTEEE